MDVVSSIPDYYQPKASLYLQLSDGIESRLTVEVIAPFTPFTMAQVLLVKGSSNTSLILPPSFIIKVYDPRFYEHRHSPGHPARSWTYTAETAAAAKRTTPRRIDFEAHQWPADEDQEGWEEWYYQNAEMQFHSESTAYALLTPLQGTGVARYLGSGTLSLSDRAISPHFLLLEYIPDARKLDGVDPDTVDLTLVRSLIDTVRQFGSLGVIHTDLNPGNMLFSPGDCPARAVVIDFGESAWREDESDEEWVEIVEQNADVYWIKKRLERQLKIDLSVLSSCN